MFKVILHGTDECDTCMRVQNRLTLSKINFEYDDVVKSNNNDFPILPVTQVINVNTKESVETFIGLLKDREIGILKVYLKANQNYN